jgi:hypothetical protein
VRVALAMSGDAEDAATQLDSLDLEELRREAGV